MNKPTPRPALKATGMRRRYARCLETELAALRARAERAEADAAAYLKRAESFSKLADEAEAELAAERARLDWLEKSDPDSLHWWTVGEPNSIRDDIDAAMKGGREMSTPTPMPRTCGEISCDECNDRYAALAAERDQLRAEVERLRSDRDCEKRLRKDADELREDAIERAMKAKADLVALEQCHDDNCRGVVQMAAELAVERARLDSGQILLTVAGERVWHCGVDLRAAIDAGMKEEAK